MKKSDLRNGMVVQLTDGTRYMVLNGNIVRGSTYMELHTYNDNLTKRAEYCPEYTIDRVYEEIVTFDDVARGTTKLLWKREEPTKEYTVEQLEAIVGHKVKIVGGNK